MGGHGGLNILPQKRWNVYNYENREKVRKDEAEEAAREQALAEEQRLRDSELRLQTLRARARQQHLPLPQQQAAAEERLLPPQDQAAQPSAAEHHAVVDADSSRLTKSLATSIGDSVPQAGALKAGHINLFEGLDSADFSALACGEGAQASDAVKPGRAQEVWEKEHKAGEEEKHRLGYGAVGKGGQQPWYARAGDLTVGEGEGGAGKIKGDAGSRAVGKRRPVEAAEAKTDSQRVTFQEPQKLDSERGKKVGPGKEIHPAKDEVRDDNGDDDEDMSSPRHKKKRKHRKRRSASQDSSSSTSLASSDDDDDNHRRRHRSSRKHPTVILERERIRGAGGGLIRQTPLPPHPLQAATMMITGTTTAVPASTLRSITSKSDFPPLIALPPRFHLPPPRTVTVIVEWGEGRGAGAGAAAGIDPWRGVGSVNARSTSWGRGRGRRHAGG
ncbi:unnamed protein product [Closterium sp. Naga37s-1]|nr:unnamed protein product [Closterium sp. Naga37s-1]